MIREDCYALIKSTPRDCFLFVIQSRSPRIPLPGYPRKNIVLFAKGWCVDLSFLYLAALPSAQPSVPTTRSFTPGQRATSGRLRADPEASNRSRLFSYLVWTEKRYTDFIKSITTPLAQCLELPRPVSGLPYSRLAAPGTMNIIRPIHWSRY